MKTLLINKHLNTREKIENALKSKDLPHIGTREDLEKRLYSLSYSKLKSIIFQN